MTDPNNPFLDPTKAEPLAIPPYEPLTREVVAEMELSDKLQTFLRDPSSSAHLIPDMDLELMLVTLCLGDALRKDPSLRDEDMISDQLLGPEATSVGHLVDYLNDHLENERRYYLPDDDREALLAGETILRPMLAGYQDFLEQAEQQKPLLAESQQRFETKIKHAVDQQGLPLSHQQVSDRLQDVTLGYAYAYGFPLLGIQGLFDPDSRKGWVAIGVSDDERERIVHHELFHALSGHKEGMRLGLKLKNDNRLWLNEAVTDMLSLLSTDPDWERIDFSDTRNGI
jgi:hypothetical protein